MAFKVRRTSTIIDKQFQDFGQVSEEPLIKIAEILVVENPLVGRYVEDLGPYIESSPELGREMGDRLRRTLEFHGATAQSYGKAGLVGLAGEKEHANMLLSTAFANPIRELIGGEAWISSVTKIASPGTLVDVPMNSMDDVYVRSHYDTMSLFIPDSPLPDEVALIFCVATRGRLNARVGGMTREEARSNRSR